MALNNHDAELLRRMYEGDKPSRRGVVIKPKKQPKKAVLRSKKETVVEEVGKAAAIPRGDR